MENKNELISCCGSDCSKCYCYSKMCQGCNPYFDKETAYKYYNEFMWGRRYAKIITVEQAIQLLQGDVDV